MILQILLILSSISLCFSFCVSLFSILNLGGDVLAFCETQWYLLTLLAEIGTTAIKLRRLNQLRPKFQLESDSNCIKSTFLIWICLRNLHRCDKINYLAYRKVWNHLNIDRIQPRMIEKVYINQKSKLISTFSINFNHFNLFIHILIRF